MDARHMGIVDLRAELGRRIRAAQLAGEATVITVSGVPGAVLVPYDWWVKQTGDDAPGA